MINQVITVDVLRNIRPLNYRQENRETPDDYIFNVALNINAKLGGTNCVSSKDLNAL